MAGKCRQFRYHLLFFIEIDSHDVQHTFACSWNFCVCIWFFFSSQTQFPQNGCIYSRTSFFVKINTFSEIIREEVLQTISQKGFANFNSFHIDSLSMTDISRFSIFSSLKATLWLILTAFRGAAVLIPKMCFLQILIIFRAFSVNSHRVLEKVIFLTMAITFKIFRSNLKI